METSIAPVVTLPLHSPSTNNPNTGTGLDTVGSSSVNAVSQHTRHSSSPIIPSSSAISNDPFPPPKPPKPKPKPVANPTVVASHVSAPTVSNAKESQSEASIGNKAHHMKSSSAPVTLIVSPPRQPPPPPPPHPPKMQYVTTAATITAAMPGASDHGQWVQSPLQPPLEQESKSSSIIRASPSIEISGGPAPPLAGKSTRHSSVPNIPLYPPPPPPARAGRKSMPSVVSESSLV